MLEGYFAVLTTIFGPLLGFHPAISELLIALIMTFVITLFFRFLIDQNKAKEIKDKVKELQAQAKEFQKENPEKANNIFSEIMKLNGKQMRMSFKAMIPVFIIAALVFPWIAATFEGPVVLLPFSLPYFEADFGWLMWYLLISIPFSTLFRKILGVNL